MMTLSYRPYIYTSMTILPRHNSEQTFLYMYIVTCKYKQIVIHQRQSDTFLIYSWLTKVVIAWPVASGRQDS